MYLIVSSKLDPDMFPNSKYDPFIISQLSNNFQYLYDKLNQPSNNNNDNNSSLESTSKELISKNKDATSMLVLILALHIGVEPRLFGGSKNKRTKKNTKQNKRTKTNTKRNTKTNKKTNKKTKRVIKMKAKRQTRKSKI